ncbi:putative transmembrane protein [Kordia algicida OT-1]|uniref:Putative transmembrane protein n=2 Tax=Kordia TaxID=221065 RepID=A9DVF4_9FLAO|nr:putative transmembrane protein [Kordia algicida OT-1]
MIKIIFMNHNRSFRFSIHLTFWVFYFFVVFYLMPDYFGRNLSFFQKIDFKLLLLVIPITYFNELYLLPVLFKKKKYLLYSLLIISILLLATIIYCNYIIECSCSFSFCLSQQLWKFLLPVIFLSLVWVLLSLFEKQKELEKTQKDRLEIELKFLKSQINPHVLFNNLNTVYAQAIKGSDNVADMILMLSENLKYILYQSEENFVPLKKDIDFIENYLEFQKLRTQGINNIIFKKNIDSYKHTIAPMLLIGLIENAFKHSLYKEDEESNIHITLTVINGKLDFECQNEIDVENGKRNTEGFQIGLKNLRKRLEIIYPKKHNFSTEKQNDSFIAKLEIIL